MYSIDYHYLYLCNLWSGAGSPCRVQKIAALHEEYAGNWGMFMKFYFCEIFQLRFYSWQIQCNISITSDDYESSLRMHRMIIGATMIQALVYFSITRTGVLWDG